MSRCLSLALFLFHFLYLGCTSKNNNTMHEPAEHEPTKQDELFLDSLDYMEYVSVKPKETQDEPIIFGLAVMKSPDFVHDLDIFRKALRESFDVTSLEKQESVDVNLFIQHSFGIIKKTALHNWLLINQELTKAKDLEGIEIGFCRHSLCKNDLERYRSKHNLHYKIEQVKFSSHAMDDNPYPMDFGSFVHLGGNSHFKNTKKIVDLWLNHPDLPTLFLTCFKGCAVHADLNEKRYQDQIKQSKNIVYYSEKTTGDVYKKLRSIGFCITPSKTEGYGHYINEARASGAIVITIDAPPMNELIRPEWGIIIPAILTDTLSDFETGVFSFDEKDLYKAVKRAMSLTHPEIEKMSKAAKKAYEADTKEFDHQWTQVITNFGKKYKAWQ